MPGGSKRRTACPLAVIWATPSETEVAGLEKHLDHAGAVVGGGLHVLDIIDQGADHAFMIVDDALLHLPGTQAVVDPDHADDRDVDLRKDVRRCAHQHEGRQQQKYQRRHHEGVGPA